MRTYARPLILERAKWNDRFSFPTFDELLQGYSTKNRSIVQHAADTLRQFSGLREKIEWQGFAWRWCIIFEHRSHPGLGWAYLIMKPDAFQISIPLTQAVIDNIPKRRTPMFIKDGVRLAARSTHMSWATWSIESPRELDHVLSIHERKYRILIETPKKEPQKRRRK